MEEVEVTTSNGKTTGWKTTTTTPFGTETATLLPDSDNLYPLYKVAEKKWFLWGPGGPPVLIDDNGVERLEVHANLPVLSNKANGNNKALIATKPTKQREQLFIEITNCLADEELAHWSTGHLPRKPNCTTCAAASQSRKPARRTGPKTKKAGRVGEVVHIDACGPISIPSIKGHKYLFITVDDASGWISCHAAQHRDSSHAIEAVKQFANEVGCLPSSIGVVRSDGGHEFQGLFPKWLDAICEGATRIQHTITPIMQGMVVS